MGFEQTIKHLDGHEVQIGSKTVTKPKQVRKFDNEGMPKHHGGGSFGDLYVQYEVEFPDALTEDQKKKIREIFS